MNRMRRHRILIFDDAAFYSLLFGTGSKQEINLRFTLRFGILHMIAHPAPSRFDNHV